MSLKGKVWSDGGGGKGYTTAMGAYVSRARRCTKIDGFRIRLNSLLPFSNGAVIRLRALLTFTHRRRGGSGNTRMCDGEGGGVVRGTSEEEEEEGRNSCGGSGAR